MPTILIQWITLHYKDVEEGVDGSVLDIFKELIRALAQTPTAWLTTGGINSGASKHAGCALKNESLATTIGNPYLS